jgi:hypothetical protein
MPLSKAQKEFIQATVEHFFYALPKDSKLLSTEISRIRSAFTGTVDEKDTDYSFLQKCIQKPSEHFQRLEKMNSQPIQLGEIREEILNIANTHICEAAKDAKLDLNESLWNVDMMLAHVCTETNNEKDFKSNKVRTHHGDNPYQLPAISGQFYTAWTIPNVTTHSVDVRIEIDLKPDAKISHSYPLEELPEFKNDTDQDRYFTIDIIDDAKDLAEEKAIELSLKYLVEHKHISSAEIKDINLEASRLLTYQIYIDAIIQKKIPTQDLWNLSKKQCRTLLQPIIIKRIQTGVESIASAKNLTDEDISILSNSAFMRLIEEKKCDILSIKNLTPEQKELLGHPHYSVKCLNGSLNITDIKQLSSQQCKNLVLPSALYLEAKNILSFENIKNMNEGVKHIISDEFFRTQLTTGKIKYAFIQNLTLNRALRLTSATAIQSVVDGKLSTHQINCLPSNASSNTLQLIQNDTINFNDVTHLSSWAINYIENNCLIRHLLTDKWIQPTELNLILPDYHVHNLPQNYTPKPLPEILHKAFNNALVDYLQLAAKGFLRDMDLRFIYDHFSTINAEINYPEQRTESDNSINRLLCYHEINERCYFHAKHRLLSILKGTPEVLHTTAIDTIENIESNCRQFNLPFSIVRNLSMTEHLKRYYLGLIISDTDKLVTQGKALGFTVLEMHEKILGMRLHAIYLNKPYNIDLRADSLLLLQKDIQIIAKKNNISHTLLSQAASKYLLLQIKREQVKNESTILQPEIFEAISQAELAASDNHTVKKHYEIWSTAFQKIILSAKLKVNQYQPRFLPPTRSLHDTKAEDYRSSPFSQPLKQDGFYANLQRLAGFITTEPLASSSPSHSLKF